jgi:hypothetical protein
VWKTKTNKAHLICGKRGSRKCLITTAGRHMAAQAENLKLYRYCALNITFRQFKFIMQHSGIQLMDHWAWLLCRCPNN